MKLTCTKVVLATVLSVIFLSCEKDSAQEIPLHSTSRIIKLDGVKFALPNLEPSLLATYDEVACTTRGDSTWQAGTKCFESVGNTCSKATNCVALPGAARSGQYTKMEIDRKIEVVEKAFATKYIY